MAIPKIFLAFLLTGLVTRLAAEEMANIPEIGAHAPVLVVGKNVHPENLMVVYTKVDANGRFLTDPEKRNQPLFDFYWLMNGRNYKPVNGLLKNEIRKRLELQAIPGGSATHFAINLNDLKEVTTDIAPPKMDVYVSATAGVPEVEAQMNLGPSDGNMRIKLSSIYTQGRAFPPAVYSVTLKGEEIVNGKPTGRKVARKYEGKDKPN
ncbi:MAG: hypothetical protein ABJF10_05735 [Chthoniobacter sp.]|uniref:hypothetical protein n=1 Tax=Chthoniobacter sp. TaxID=2510640 RepID=UPI0032A67B53